MGAAPAFEYEDACCIIGYTKDHKPIWKKVGIRSKTKSSGRDVILLDRSFNPAGAEPMESSPNSVAIYFFHVDNKERKGKEYAAPSQLGAFPDFDDDIPF